MKLPAVPRVVSRGQPLDPGQFGYSAQPTAPAQPATAPAPEFRQTDNPYEYGTLRTPTIEPGYSPARDPSLQYHLRDGRTVHQSFVHDPVRGSSPIEPSAAYLAQPESLKTLKLPEVPEFNAEKGMEYKPWRILPRCKMSNSLVFTGPDEVSTLSKSLASASSGVSCYSYLRN